MLESCQVCIQKSIYLSVRLSASKVESGLSQNDLILDLLLAGCVFQKLGSFFHHPRLNHRRCKWSSFWGGVGGHCLYIIRLSFFSFSYSYLSFVFPAFRCYLLRMRKSRFGFRSLNVAFLVFLVIQIPFHFKFLLCQLSGFPFSRSKSFFMPAYSIEVIPFPTTSTNPSADLIFNPPYPSPRPHPAPRHPSSSNSQRCRGVFVKPSRATLPYFVHLYQRGWNRYLSVVSRLRRRRDLHLLVRRRGGGV